MFRSCSRYGESYPQVLGIGLVLHSYRVCRGVWRAWFGLFRFYLYHSPELKTILWPLHKRDGQRAGRPQITALIFPNFSCQMLANSYRTRRLSNRLKNIEHYQAMALRPITPISIVWCTVSLVRFWILHYITKSYLGQEIW